MAKRKPISTRTRFEIFKRDRFACQYCGRQPPQVTLQIDHVVAVANGGDNSDVNLLTSCADCNSGKSDRPLTEVPPPVKVQLAERRERAAQLKALNDFLAEQRCLEDFTIDMLGYQWFNHFHPEKDRYVFGPSRKPMIRNLLRQLPETEIEEAIDIAHGRFPAHTGSNGDLRTWKYFYGICKNKIKERSPHGG